MLRGPIGKSVEYEHRLICRSCPSLPDTSGRNCTTNLLPPADIKPQRMTEPPPVIHLHSLLLM